MTINGLTFKRDDIGFYTSVIGCLTLRIRSSDRHSRRSGKMFGWGRDWGWSLFVGDKVIFDDGFASMRDAAQPLVTIGMKRAQEIVNALVSFFTMSDLENK